MQNLPFDTAVKGSEGDIIVSRQAPFGSFALAEGLRQFYEDIAAHQMKEAAVMQGGFVYGGAITDAGLNRKPKDIDIYIASPNMVLKFKRFLGNPAADDDFMNEDEWADEVFGYQFPIVPMRGFEARNSKYAGDYFQFAGRARIDGVWHPIDIKIGTENISMVDFLRRVPAPIMAAAMALDRDESYAYHRDCVDHTLRGILCTETIKRRDLIEKASRKNLELITPAALAVREKEARPVSGVHVSKNGEWRPVI